MSEHSEAEIAAKKMAQSDTVLVDMSPWPNSTPEDWRKEAKILREQRPDALAAAALCDAVADALEKEPVPVPANGWVVVEGKYPMYLKDGRAYHCERDAQTGEAPVHSMVTVEKGIMEGRIKALFQPDDEADTPSEPQGWWETDQWVLVDRKDPKYLKGGEIYFSQYEASIASAVPVHGSGPTTAAIKSGRITPLSDALTALAQGTSEDEEAQEAVRDTLPDKKWVVVEAEARKDAEPAFKGQSTSDDLIIMDEISAFSIQVASPPAMSIHAPDGTVLLTIHADGRWEVDTERAPEAAKIFLDEVANYSERLKEAEQRTRTSLRGRESGAQRRREHDPTTTPTEEKS